MLDNECKWCGEIDINDGNVDLCTQCFEISDSIFGRITPIRRGVEIIFANNDDQTLRLPPGVLLQDENLEIGFRSLKGKEFRYLRIRGAEAAQFTSGSRVGLRMLGSSHWIVVATGAALLIRHLGTGKTTYNNHLCRKCFSLNYEILDVYGVDRFKRRQKCKECGAV